MVGALLGCRHCHNLTYSSQKISGMSKAIGKLISSREVREIAEEIDRTIYRDKYTKKFSRLMKKYGQYQTRSDGAINILKKHIEKLDKKNEKILSKILKNN
jgi:pyruvate-formate lyase-activating enzyme